MRYEACIDEHAYLCNNTIHHYERLSDCLNSVSENYCDEKCAAQYCTFTNTATFYVLMITTILIVVPIPFLIIFRKKFDLDAEKEKCTRLKVLSYGYIFVIAIALITVMITIIATEFAVKEAKEDYLEEVLKRTYLKK